MLSNIDLETYRISSIQLFVRNLFDTTVLISTCMIFAISFASTTHSTLQSFLLMFSIFTWLINHQIELYRSFNNVRDCVRVLSRDRGRLKSFLKDYMGAKSTASETRDTFKWMNEVIAFFWPHLSHVIHHELNDFLKNFNSLARSKGDIKKLFYAIIKQLDTKILAIERCELGARAPYIREISLADCPKDVLVAYNISMAYEGNMNISFICRYFCCSSRRIGLKDVFINFNGRLSVGRSLEDVTVTLMELPKFGYKGIALVELAELKIARRAINNLISEHLLHPRSMSLNLRTIMSNTLRVAPDSESDTDEVPLRTKLVARMLLLGCFCSNCCIRCCQEESHKR